MVSKDVFGFDELGKSFKRLEKRYPNQADALLMARGQAVNKRTKQLTPVKTKKLRNSWRLKKVKLYKGGTVRVVRVQSAAPHAHLIEYGHNVYTTGGRKTGAEGYHMLEKAINESASRFSRDAQQMLDKLIESEGLD